MPKLTDKQKKKIIADYVDNGNYSETARMNGVNKSTVQRLISKNQEVQQKAQEKKEENTQDMLQYLETKKEDKKRVIELCFKALEDKLVSPDMFTSIRDIAMVYGILVDKDLKYKEIMNNRVKEDKLEKVEELLSKIESEANDNKLNK